MANLYLAIDDNYDYKREDRKMLNVKIKYLRDIKNIDVIEKGDWVDLRAAEDVELKAGEFTVIHLGVAMELPKGYFAMIVPRSSTFAKWGIIQTNHVGIIDEAYCGDNDEWGLPVLAFRSTKIHKNDRICQFAIFKKTDTISFSKVKSLGNADRNGFGSTGDN